MGKIRRPKRARVHRADPILGRVAAGRGDQNGSEQNEDEMEMSNAIFEDLGSASIERQAKAADAV